MAPASVTVIEIWACAAITFRVAKPARRHPGTSQLRSRFGFSPSTGAAWSQGDDLIAERSAGLRAPLYLPSGQLPAACRRPGSTLESARLMSLTTLTSPPSLHGYDHIGRTSWPGPQPRACRPSRAASAAIG